MQPIILFVGSNPSNQSATDAAFHGSTRSSQILTEWSRDVQGMKMHINVADYKTENNRPLNATEIKENLDRLQDKLQMIKPDHIVALGKTAAKALKALGREFYEMPHPSGLNRKLNDKAYVAEKVKGLLEFTSRPLNAKT